MTKTLTTLEQQMYEAISGADWPPSNLGAMSAELHSMAIDEAKAAAEVAKRYAQAAWNEARSKGFHGSAYYSSFEDYAKDKGIIE